MGFFSKVFKGVKKVVKKIGKGIKSAFAKVGKFMNKLGIVGQIALGLMLPGIGASLGKWAIGAMGSGNAVVAAAGQFVNAAVSIGTKVSGAFKTVTEGVFKVVGQTVGTALNKIPKLGQALFDVTGGKINIVDMDSFAGVFDTMGEVMTDVASSGRDLFSMDTLTAKNKLGQDLIDKTQAAIAKTTTATPVEIQDQLMQSEYTETNLPSAGKIDLTKSRLEEFKVSPKGTEFIDGVPVINGETFTGKLADRAAGATEFIDGVPVIGENFTGKESLLGQAPTVKLDVAADTTIVPVDATEAAVDVVDKDAGYWENLRNKVADEYKEFEADPFGVEGLSGRVTDGIGTQFMQGLGLENKPEFTSVDNRSSNNFNFGGLQESTAIRSSNNQAFNPLEYSQNQDFLAQHTVGYGAAQWDANREYQYSMGRTG
jgi:hypothetical protein|tara:strand:+ start:855 stop:2138 length:1284 start_codon:yes stop_codon:yes gene_type:complete